MHAVSGADKELRLAEGPDDGREFRATDAGADLARIVGLEDRVDARLIIIAAPADGRLQPVRPLRRVLRVDTDAAFPNLVAPDIGKEAALECAGQRQIDRVIARLHPEGGLHWQASERAVQRARSVGAGHHAIVMLMELIALRWIA